MGFFEKVRIIVAWCELRQDFRHFRVDRISRCSLDQRYPRRRPNDAEGVARPLDGIPESNTV